MDSLKDLAKLFLKLGTTAFGGPVAHHLHDAKGGSGERRGWMDHRHFYGPDPAVLPTSSQGPNSTEMAIHIGI